MSSKPAHASRPLSRLRPVAQALFLLLFLYLFFNISYPLSERLANNFFFNLDPLIALTMALTGGIAVSWLLMSVVTVVLTVVFGRVFCGWVCPLGTIYDWSAKVVPAGKDQPSFADGPYKNVKYWLLVFLLTGSVAGFSAALFFDPLVLPLSANYAHGETTLRTLQAIKAEFPEAKTTMGASNISFGLLGRARVNGAFLIAAIAHGLDSAVCDPTRREVREAILLGRLIAGRDRYCRGFTRAVRRGDFER